MTNHVENLSTCSEHCQVPTKKRLIMATLYWPVRCFLWIIRIEIKERLVEILFDQSRWSLETGQSPHAFIVRPAPPPWILFSLKPLENWVYQKKFERLAFAKVSTNLQTRDCFFNSASFPKPPKGHLENPPDHGGRTQGVSPGMALESDTKYTKYHCQHLVYWH